MNAHLVSMTILGQRMHYVVLNEEPTLEPTDTPHTATHVKDIDGAFEFAAAHNAPLLQNGKQLLQGTFE